MALGIEDIQKRNTILQADLKVANANRKRITDAISQTTPKVSAYGGYAPAAPVWQPGQQAAYENYQGQLADNEKEMSGITTRAQQLTQDANAFTNATKAQNYAAQTGVPLQNQPPAPASTAATAGASAPAGGAPTTAATDPMFKNVQTSAGMTPQQIIAQSLQSRGVTPANDALARQYGNPDAPRVTRTIDLGAGNFNSPGFFGGAYDRSGESASTPTQVIKSNGPSAAPTTGYTKDFFINSDGQSAPSQPSATPSGQPAALSATPTPYGGGRITTDLASSVDKNGVPTFDNNSIARLIQRNGGDARPTAGGPAYPAAAPVYASVPTAGPSGQGMGVVIADPNNDPTKRLLTDLGTEIFRASLNPNSRSKRDVLTTLLGQKGGIIAQGNQIASTEGIAAANRQAELARTNMTEAGANNRTNATLQNQMAVEGMRRDSDIYRALLAANAPQKPQYTTDDRGNYVQISGTTATPVVSADGKPLALPKTEKTNPNLDVAVQLMKGYTATMNDMQADPAERADARAKLAALGGQFGFGGQQGTAAQALADAKQAISSGAISKADAAKRLRDAGFNNEAGQL